MHTRIRSIAAAALAALLAGAAHAEAEPTVQSGPAPGLDLWPLLEWSEGEKTILYPLFVHEPDFTLVFPVYARTRAGRDHHLLWPIVKVSDGSLERAAPFWFRTPEGELTIFPFLHQTPEVTRWWVGPLFGEMGRDGDYALLLPLAGRGESRGGSWTWAGPLFARDTPVTRTRVLFPLVIHSRSEPGGAGRGERLSILWPTYTRRVSHDALGALRERERRFLVFRDRREADGSRVLSILGLPIWERSPGGGLGS